MWTAVHHLQIQTAASGTQWHWVPVAPGGLNEFVSGRRCWLNTGALLSVFSQVGGQTGGRGVNNSSLLPALCMTFFFPRQKKAVVTFEKHERISGRIGFFRREEGMFRPRIDETHGWMCRASNGRRKKRIDYRDPMWCCTQFFFPHHRVFLAALHSFLCFVEESEGDPRDGERLSLALQHLQHSSKEYERRERPPLLRAHQTSWEKPTARREDVVDKRFSHKRSWGDSIAATDRLADILFPLLSVSE